ncbi:MAG: acyltransferase [Psychrosphaera sp.]|nr:acyltransferase [Psychrosphaera sp.]
MKDKFRINNFDLLRLLAALQVAIYHTSYQFNTDPEHTSILLALFNYFPGVPIFFFISGFLISKSFENNSNLADYIQNRALRIFPALIVVTLLSISGIYLTGYLTTNNVGVENVIAWVIGQLTFIQFYNPDFLRGFGFGAINASLWTITVELQFYIVIPILYGIFGLAKPLNASKKVIYLIGFFMLFFIARFYFVEQYVQNVWFKLAGVTFLPWLFMFLLGVLFQKNFAFFYRLLAGKAVYMLVIYLLTAYLTVTYWGWRMGNGINPLLYVLLVATVFSCAYTLPTLSHKLFRGNDISYGIYIYHMPIVNFFLYYGYNNGISMQLLAMLICVAMAMTSWVLIEKPAIKLKKHPFNPFNSKVPRKNAEQTQ